MLARWIGRSGWAPNNSKAGDLSKPQSTHVIFDLDDTLYPERQFAHSGFRAAGRYAAATWGIDGLGDDMIRLLDDGHLGAVFRLSMANRMPDHTQDHIAELIGAYRDHDPEIELFEDGRWALEYFGARARLGLITDGTAKVQAAKVAALAIAHHFAAIVLTDELGGRDFFKPHPRAYETIEARIGRPGDRYVYIGDNPAKDFVTPNQRGWMSVQVMRENPIHDQHAVADGGEPQHRVHSLRELADLISL